MNWRFLFFTGVACLLVAFSLHAAEVPKPVPATTSNLKVTCTPQTPRSNEPVEISIVPEKPANSVQLEYQIVDPGKYISCNDSDYSRNWISLPMTPAGDHYSAIIPPNLQTHRRLIRYRFKLDGAIVPDKKNNPGNFAYFCFDGIGSWKGAIEPGSIDPTRSKVVEYDQELMNSIQPLFLIAKNKDVEDSTWKLRDHSGKKWFGTIVYNGQVYDHVTFRARGGINRYELGKNMWKIEFSKDQPLPLIDDYGAAFSQPITDMDLNPGVQQSGVGFRGEHGLFEVVSYKMFQLVDVPAPYTTYLQYRIIDAPAELGKTQYDGDLWGLYYAVETPDSNFLKQHNLPKGNLFKMEKGTGPGGGEIKAKSPLLPNDNSDLVAYMSHFDGAKPKSLLSAILTGPGDTSKTSNQWFRDNINLPGYYSYRSIVDIVHHYDLSEGKNFYLFHDPNTDIWSVFPWDIDISWYQNQWGDGLEPYKLAFLDKPEFNLEYRNRLREIRDLMFNPDQMNRMIDSCAALIYTPDKNSFVDVDRAVWDYSPAMNGNGNHARPGLFYRRSVAPGGFPGMLAHMKQYVDIRSKWIDSSLLGADSPPKTPVVKYIGPSSYLKDNLTFSCSSFQPADNSTFAAIQWRIARIDKNDPTLKSNDHSWEIQALWQSPELKDFTPTFKIPGDPLKPGEYYRIRAKVKNDLGVWSHWSDPVEIRWPEK